VTSVRLSEIRKFYGEQSALSNVTLEIEDGELMVLVGPSGCGKSTLLRAIAGLEPIQGGVISIGDKAVNNLPPHKRDVAMVFQNYALYPNLTVFENIAFPLRALKTSSKVVSEQVEQVADRLELKHLLRRRPRELSGGQRQRVAIARAIIRNPAVFLMDEPLSNLDAKLRIQTRQEILRLQRNLNVTTIFVTHDQVEAMTMGTRITVMDGGQVQQVGTPYEVYHRPANVFVAGFIGSPAMNLVTASLEVHNDKTPLLYRGDGVWTLARVDVDSSVPARQVVLGIRPEDLTLTKEGSGMMTGVIDLVEYLGSETVVTVKVEDRDWLVKVSGNQKFSWGETVHLTATPDSVYLFDVSSGVLSGTLAEALSPATEPVEV